MPPSVTVIVCTHNRARLLEACIRSLISLDVPPSWRWNILIVDNASSDGTAATVRDAIRAGESGRLQYQYEPIPGVAAARNCGLKHATGEWIAFIDDDEVADPKWLRTLVTFALEQRLLIVGGAVRLALPSHCDAQPVEVRRIFGETPEGAKPQPFSRRLTPATCNVLIHRSVFDKVGPFDVAPKEAGEDTSFFRLARRAGIDGWFMPDAVVVHSIEASRLTREAIDAAARRVGWGFCRIDRRDHGTLGVIARTAARIGKVMTTGPLRYAVAKARRDQPSLVGLRIDALRNASYVMAALAIFAPGIVGDRAPDFRDEPGRTGGRGSRPAA